MDTDRLERGFGAGVRATLAMSMPMVVSRIAGLSPVPKPVPLAIAQKVIGEDAPTPVVAVATLAAHFGYGGSWAAALAAVRPDADRSDSVALGVGLWALLGTVLMPWLGWGFFGRKESPAVAPATLLPHLVYGAAVGWLLERGEPREARAQPADVEVTD
jgi:hypothetical protein